MSANNMMTQAFNEALVRIAIAEDLPMRYRLAALQVIEDFEMGGHGEVMTEKDVHAFTFERFSWMVDIW